jgi:hypothetical protein
MTDGPGRGAGQRERVEWVSSHLLTQKLKGVCLQRCCLGCLSLLTLGPVTTCTKVSRQPAGVSVFSVVSWGRQSTGAHNDEAGKGALPLLSTRSPRQAGEKMLPSPNSLRPCFPLQATYHFSFLSSSALHRFRPPPPLLSPLLSFLLPPFGLGSLC